MEAPLLRRGKQMRLPCPNSIKRVGPRGLKAPKEAETWAFLSPGLKGKAQAKPEWAMASIRSPVSTSQAWEGGVAAPVMSEAGARLPKTGGGSFSGCRETEGEGWEHAPLGA